jgi:hypothetical protein
MAMDLEDTYVMTMESGWETVVRWRDWQYGQSVDSGVSSRSFRLMTQFEIWV